MLLRCLVTVAAFCAVCSGTPAAAGEALPRPSGLEPNVRFWIRIYSEVDGGGGLIHDAENLDVVYETLRFPEGLSSRSRQRLVEKIKKRYRTVLHRLGSGKRGGLTDEEARVLALWPEGVADSTLRHAAGRVRFQLGQADKFRAGVVRAGRWATYIERVLLEHGVPVELVALPHVESSYNPRAYSRVGAAGIWQFTRSTGRRYMRVDHVVDERMDPFAATVGAARLLRDNYKRLESWPLAITAYNHGAGGMARAVRTLGTDDIATISRRYRSRTFGFASRNFYAEFLAALDIHRDPEEYFGALPTESPLHYTTVTTDAFYSAATLVRALDVEADILREHNPALRPSVWSGAKLVPRNYPLRVPSEGLVAPAVELLASIPDSERIARQHRDRFHTVHRGETLSQIGRRYGVSQRELVALNNLRSRHRIRAGQVLRLPDAGSPPTVVARREPPGDGIYRVERGDSLWVISQRFGASQQELVRWNGLRNRHKLAVGQLLRVAPPSEPAVTLIASAPSAATDATLARLESRIESQPAELVADPQDEPVDDLPEEIVADELAGEPVDDEPLEDLAADEPPDDLVAELPIDLVPGSPEETVTGSPEEPVGEPPAVVTALASAALPPTAEASEETEEANGPDPSNYAVTRDHRITVQAEETLGHYAEWLEVPTSRLRSLNGMTYETPLVIGRQKKLDFSRVSPEVFEQRRLAYHRDLQESFFDAFVVTGTTLHTLRRGESLWYIANERYEVPIWLLRQHNPDLDFGDLRAGTPLVIPILEPRRP